MATVEEVQAKVQRFLQNNLNVVELRGDTFVVPYGSTFCKVYCREWGDDDVLVKLLAPVLHEIPLTDQVYKVVAERTGTYIFGHMSMNIPDDAQGTVDFWFEHALYGNTLDEPELMHSLVGIVRAADDLDDELQPVLGGNRTYDK